MALRDYKRAFIHADDTLRHAIEAIEAGAIQIALVVDEAGRLLGAVTDGDNSTGNPAWYRAGPTGSRRDEHPPNDCPVGNVPARPSGLDDRPGQLNRSLWWMGKAGWLAWSGWTPSSVALPSRKTRLSFWRVDWALALSLSLLIRRNRCSR